MPVSVPSSEEHAQLAADVEALDAALAAHLDAPPVPGPGLGPQVFDVRDFGATCEVDRDDAPAIGRAVAAASAYPNGVVQLGRAHGMASEVTVPRGVRIQGLGARQTVVAPLGSNWCFTVKDAGRSGEWQAEDETYRFAADKSGVEFRDLMVNGIDRARKGNGIRVLRADDLLMDNVTFGFLGGTALQLGNGSEFTVGSVRESDLRRVKVFKSGGPGVPSVLIQNGYGGESSDGTNQVYLHQFRLVYNHGGMVIRNHHAGETLRRIIISDAQIHGLSHGGTVGNVTDHDLITIEGGVISVVIANSMVNGSAPGLAVVRTKASAITGRSPSGLTLTNLTAAECGGDVVAVDRLADLAMTSRVNAGSIGGAVLRSKDASLNYDVALTGTGVTASKLVGLGSTRGAVTLHGKPLLVGGA